MPDEPKKERFNPSRLVTYQRCHFLYYVKYELNRVPVQTVPHYITLGSLFHAASEAYDRCHFASDKSVDWRESIRSAVRSIRTQPNYNPKDSDLLDLLAYDTQRMMVAGPYEAVDGNTYEPEYSHSGGYAAWRKYIQRSRSWEIVSLEKRYAADLGRVIVAPQPDGVIRENGKLWVLERKTTSTESAGFEKKYRVSLQTTLEAMAVEDYYQEEVMGVYILPVKYTRKKSSKWRFDKLPQPLYRVTYCDPHPIPKSKAVKSQAEMCVDQIMQDIEWRRQTKLWIQNPSSCMMGRAGCDLYELCWGNLKLQELVPRPDDGIQEALLRDSEN